MIHDYVSKEQTARAVLIRQKRDRIAHLNAKFSIQADKRDTEDCDKCSQAILFQWPGFCDGPCCKRRKRGDMKKMVRGFAAGCLPDSKLCLSEECML